MYAAVNYVFNLVNLTIQRQLIAFLNVFNLTGKTSVALALCRQLYDPSQIRRRVLELNASDERGISVVRDKIKHFASLAIGSNTSSKSKSFFKKGGGADAMDVDGEEGKPKKSYPNPPYKIIILDEADAVTRDAQAALRRVIEAYSKVTRFILICNYVTRIIEPLASRCAKFRFQPLPVESMKERICYIAEHQDCQFEEGKKDEVIDEILSLSEGDMRRAVTTLQSAHSLACGPNEVIKKDAIAEMAGLPPPDLIDGLIQTLQTATFDKMKSFVMENIVLEGYSAEFVLSALIAKIIVMDNVTDEAKSKIAIQAAQSDKNLVDGSDETLQLLTVCSLALGCMKKRKQ